MNRIESARRVKKPKYKYWMILDGSYTHITSEDPGDRYDERYTSFVAAKKALVDYFKSLAGEYKRGFQNARKLKKSEV